MAHDPGRHSGPDGVLVVDKPAGPTSHDVVALVRRLAGTRRIGHGGTLDPFATGVLPLFLGSATRLVEYHARDRKAYRATVCFGASSTTDDLEGELQPAPAPAGRPTVETALANMVGEIAQQPPAHSAIKIAGRRAYARARAGEAVKIPERAVTIHAIGLVDWNDQDLERPIAVIDVECSAGTYVRALARDLGVAVGSAAYLGALVRTASGPFRIEHAVSVDAVRGAAGEGAAAFAELLLPPDAGLEALPVVELSEAEVQDVARGRFITPGGGAPSDATGPIRLVAPDGRLVGMASARGGRLAPDKVFVAADG
ncbi:MAG TPA: tRNA pseudouridine(55) synthase TruB [Candidatus Limnocylindrales bacterium]|jgi:tRNA pseudouridine55 synthase